ncbi:uncharacterized protein PHALS_15361 [Plasmopara halstedii]|uniref:Uncharacterized protein n=1 Tax=Plasmopara halstedii TaxID=4781 RepID=A0A0P1ASC4_PLAHL|nr:uncharacterized protein PHALS_15361 [Plasmopara halstedii]CEG44616.1 hypothetical protein PHALS_15361 [Plasmopara halstedii]|eukprot:XP_024580985.1 hypothetical protein PHALS_15361 [Plasmopara halstedii]
MKTAQANMNFSPRTESADISSKAKFSHTKVISHSALIFKKNDLRLDSALEFRLSDYLAS